MCEREEIAERKYGSGETYHDRETIKEREEVMLMMLSTHSDSYTHERTQIGRNQL
jgi:hypothetical protein